MSPVMTGDNFSESISTAEAFDALEIAQDRTMTVVIQTTQQGRSATSTGKSRIDGKAIRKRKTSASRLKNARKVRTMYSGPAVKRCKYNYSPCRSCQCEAQGWTSCGEQYKLAAKGSAEGCEFAEIMFVTVCFGDNQVALCNTSCKVLYLKMHLRKMMGLKQQTLIDLCDETGRVVSLDKFEEEDADKVLAERSTYILLEKRPIGSRSDDAEQRTRFSYVPLLRNFKNKYPNLTSPLSFRSDKSRPKAIQ